ncbi:hypothetical protein PVK06_007571 [Gossypium arboreum]|uniref:RRM domain-containing protein n=1 Tax=Gossypium arboreum TaxID=29729 RepID=A0ABR0QHR3_GOSAR|nr:hypothetical protein PVK06_007571 [Gossypium arboreum]
MEGKRFGFVRFTNMEDAQRAISRLDGFVLLGKKIGVKMARFSGNRRVWRKVQAKKYFSRVGVMQSRWRELSDMGKENLNDSLRELIVKRIKGRYFHIEVQDDELMEILKVASGDMSDRGMEDLNNMGLVLALGMGQEFEGDPKATGGNDLGFNELDLHGPSIVDSLNINSPNNIESPKLNKVSSYLSDSESQRAFCRS